MSKDFKRSNLGGSQPVRLDQPPIPEGAPHPDVFLIVPTTGSIDYYVVFWMSRQGPKVAVRPFLHKRGGFVEDMRQQCLELFLQTGIEWLFFLDSDTIPSFPISKAVSRANSIGAKLVAYPTPFIGPYPGVASNLFIGVEDPQTGDMTMGGVPWHELPWDQVDDMGQRAMFDIEAAGLAATLIHRDVVATLMEAASNGEADYPFRGIWKEGKLYYGEDQAFFLRAGAAGFKVYADLECWCSHRKQVLLSPNLATDFAKDTNSKVHLAAPYDPTPYAALVSGRPIVDGSKKLIIGADGDHG